MRVTHLLDVRHELLGHLAIREKGVGALRGALPRSQMNFVDRHGPVEPAGFGGAGRHPRAVTPRIPVQIPDDGGAAGVALEKDAVRIRLLQHALPLRVRISNLYFSPSAKSGMKISQTPVFRRAHRRDAAVPAVEVADYADAIRVGRPHREMHAGGRALHDAVRAKLLEGAVMGCPR